MNARVEEALNRLFSLTDIPLPEYRDVVTDELCYVTDSSLSYVAVMNLEEDVLTMVGWSKSAMQACAVPQRPIVYMLEDTGLWGDAVRERHAVITNDYLGLVKPTKRGYPAGHVSIRRHMNVPIFDGDHVVLVAGVGNKVAEYTQADADAVADVMQAIWQEFQMRLWEATW